MNYKKRITATKVATPAIILIGGSNLLKALFQLSGNEIDDSLSYEIVASVYALGKGFVYWINHR